MLERRARLLALFLAGVVVAGVVLLAGMAWSDLRRVERIRAHVGHTARVQSVSLELQHWLLADLSSGANEPVIPHDLRRELVALHALDTHLDPRTDARLDLLLRLLPPDRPVDPQDIAGALLIVREIARSESQAEVRLLSQVSDDVHQQLEVVTAILTTLAVIGLLGYWSLRQRILKPLGDLRALLAHLASGAFNVVSPGQVHPALVPVFQNYNHLVTRLQALEAEHESRARSLEGEVRAATEALLDQQRTLARAERLAVAGEMAAGLAHELRNPLAGVLMSLGNLRRDVADPELAERLALVIAEIERMTRLLNDYLSTARHAPEVARPVKLRRLIEDLLGLLRYQVPAHVKLECSVPDHLECTVPRDRLRQALLNLVINSVQALGEDAGRVLVSARREGNSVALAVCDDGPGFPPSLLTGGVQPFATGREAGTGLGLAMVRRLALDLGGELELENMKPRGACARLVVP